MSSEVSSPEMIESGFKAFALSQEVLNSLDKLGFQSPTPVQQNCIPLLLGEETDLIALAKTGTGKTGAFGIPLIEKLENKPEVQALVLCPTRELATQVAANLQAFGSAKNLKVAAVVGGESYRRQIEALRRGPQIVVSTPGRLVDLMDQQIMDLSSVEYFILDEADEMLSFGFKESLETIWETLADNEKKVHTWLFSATMSESIHRLTGAYLTDPKEVRLNQNQETIKVDSYVAVVYQEEKEDALSLAILAEPEFYGIIFAQTKQQVAQLELKLRSFGIEVDSLHGDKVQAERVRTIKRFKSRETQILVATDVAARGLDVEDLTHVVNFELPWDAETYTHRIGRTARAGKQGTVWNFVSPKETHLMRKFEVKLKTQFKALKVPSKQEVNDLVVKNWLNSLIKTSQYDRELASLDTILNSQEGQVPEISYEARTWIAKLVKHLKIGVPTNLRTPRLLDYVSSKKSSSTGGRSSEGRSERGGFEGPRSGGRRFSRDSGRPARREFGGGFEPSQGREFSGGSEASSVRRPRKDKYSDKVKSRAQNQVENSETAGHFEGGEKSSSRSFAGKGKSFSRDRKYSDRGSKESSDRSDRKSSVSFRDKFKSKKKS